MKIRYKILHIFVIITGFTLVAVSQPSPPPVLPDQHGKKGNIGQNEAPLGGGADVLIVLSAIYLGRRLVSGKRGATEGI